MIQNDEYIVFDLKALFFYILRQWKAVIIFAVIIALALGGVMAYSEYKDSAGNAEGQQQNSQLVFWENQVAATETKVNNLYDYLQNSVLMQADHRNVYIAKAIYYVDSGYEILPNQSYQNTDKTFTLAWHYCYHLGVYNIFQDIASEMGLAPKYLMELVKVTQPNDFTVSIHVIHPEEQSAKRIMAALQQKMDRLQLELSQSVADHTLTLMMDTCGIYIDKDLSTTQQKTYQELWDLQDDLEDYRQELSALKQGTDNAGVTATFVKWFVLGGAVAVILMVAYLFVRSVLKNRLHASGQLIAGFQATVLGEAICSRKRLPAVTKVINKLEGCLTEDSEANHQFLAENIKNHCAEAKSILLCTDANSELSAALAESLNKHLSDVRLVPAGQLLKEADALHALTQCDAVVVVAQRDLSKNTAIQKMLKLINSYKKDLLGFIMTY